MLSVVIVIMPRVALWNILKVGTKLRIDFRGKNSRFTRSVISSLGNNPEVGYGCYIDI